MGWFDKGKSDAQKGQGPKNTNNMPYQDREKYDAGYNKGKNEK